MSSRFLLLVLTLLVPRLAWADAPGIQLYEDGEYETAAQAFTQVLANPQSSPQERALAHIYLAASLHALGRLEETRQQLEVLAREHPEQRVDAVRFPPELVALAEAIRQRQETEREYARKEAERLKAQQEALQRPPPEPPTPPGYLRPEVLGLYEALGHQGTVGVGLAYHQGQQEISARVLLNSDPAFTPAKFYTTIQAHGGVLLGHNDVQPILGLRATLAPGAGSYGGGLTAGLRYVLPANFVALVDLGADYFFVTGDDLHRHIALTAQAGLGFDVRLFEGH